MARDFQNDNFSYVCELITQLYHKKTSPVTHLLRLLQLTHKKDQTVEDFAREIRIRAFDCIYTYNCSTNEREELMLECFVNGLKNDILKTVLKHLKPSSVDEAVKMIKKEDKAMGQNRHDTVEIVNCINNKCQAQIEELKKQIDLLKREISFLKTSRYGRQHPNYARVTTQDGVRNVPQLRRSLPQQNFNRTPRGACYNCKRTGHYASACRMPRQCYNCGQKGHISKFCKQINQLINSEIDSNESSAGMRYDEEFPVLSVSNKFKDLTDENDIHGTIEEEVCLTDFEVRPKKQKAMWKRTQQKKK